MQFTNQKTTPVIMAGGSGTRLWPLSRSMRPKQFQQLIGNTTPFQETCQRVADQSRFTAPIIVTAESYVELVHEQLAELSIEPLEVIVEPMARNTGPAIAAALISMKSKMPNGRILVLPSDHLIHDRAAFLTATDRAEELVLAGDLITTFGIEPTEPHTGYGYICRGSALVVSETTTIDRFVEKPNRQTADQLISDKGALWNSGMFFMSVKRGLRELAVHAPEILASVNQALKFSKQERTTVHLEAVSFSRCPDISIDYALMEKTSYGAVVAVDCGWSDIGGFTALWQQHSHDLDGNATNGDVITKDTRNSFIRSDGRLVAVVGLDDVVVVDSGDAVLVTSKDRSQDVKSVVAELSQSGNQVAHEFTEQQGASASTRPWGSYQILDEDEGFKVKRITVKPGGRLSLQYHHHRAEHWTVVSGVATVTVDDEEHTLKPNQSVHIPLGAHHRLENFGTEPVHLIEVQCGTYLGEDDIVRLDDVYGRDAVDQAIQPVAAE
ncbi:MAG: mannose-1-phosphate guanylyltransferase/mannose-6-phosphate isomerase [Alphaproteobacteria bacterium]|nr:mannose-1-phosphate guanylyltransferase/mannose-6-phosphate isomerase [Alphaproteobacteria bacterium SS10]